MTRIENKIPPPVIGLICALLIWALARSVPGPIFKHPALTITAAVICIAGLSIDLMSLLKFRAAKTTVNPLKPQNANALVLTGFFNYSRNPMYVGMLFMLIGWSLYCGHPAALLGLIGFVLYINRFQIIPEERAMIGNFGEAYEAYMKRVRRWV